LPALTRTFRTPRGLDERVSLPGCTGKLRPISIIDLGHEEPTILLTTSARASCVTLVSRYAQRMLIENGRSAAIQFCQRAARSSMVGLKAAFDWQITLLASGLYRLLATRLGREYRQATAKKIFRNLLIVSATVQVLPRAVVVTSDERAHNPCLAASGLANQPTPTGALRCGSPTPLVADSATVGSPRFLANPMVPMPCSWTPAGSTYQARRYADAAPRLKHVKGFRAITLSGLDRTAWALAVYASDTAVARRSRKTCFPLLTSSTGWD
jgi:hypothetical protein